MGIHLSAIWSLNSLKYPFNLDIMQEWDRMHVTKWATRICMSFPLPHARAHPSISCTLPQTDLRDMANTEPGTQQV